MKHIPNIIMTVIPHRAQRLSEVGDYFKLSNGWTEFKISEMKNPDYEFLVFVHEVIEQYLTQRKGITAEMVDEWDKSRASGPNCPYREEDEFATFIEQTVAKKLGIDWDIYDKYIDELK